PPTSACSTADPPRSSATCSAITSRISAWAGNGAEWFPPAAGMRDEVTTAEWTRRVARLSLWAYLVWVVLTWTATVEDQVVGIIVAIMCGLAFAPLGPVVAPSAVLRPRRFAA